MLQLEKTVLHKISALSMLMPSNFHGHLRQGALMRAIAKYLMQYVKYLVAMPNTNPPVRTLEDAVKYYNEIVLVVAQEEYHHLKLLMTLYYTDLLTPKMIEEIAASTLVRAVKYYPPHPGATTGSGYGIPLVPGCPVLRAMEASGVRLLGHFETVHDKHGRELPHAQREEYFMEHEYPRLRDAHPDLLISVEHGSDKRSVQRVKEDTSGNTVMTVTPQHLNFTDEDLERRSWRNLLKCMPIEKTLNDLLAVREFAASGDERAIGGDDDAPHLSKTKLNLPFEKAVNGCFLPHSIYLYAKAFHATKALDHRFVKFMCLNGPKWWGLPAPESHEVIHARFDNEDLMKPVRVPEEKDEVYPLGWSVERDRLVIEPL